MFAVQLMTGDMILVFAGKHKPAHALVDVFGSGRAGWRCSTAGDLLPPDVQQRREAARVHLANRTRTGWDTAVIDGHAGTLALSPHGTCA